MRLKKLEQNTETSGWQMKNSVLSPDIWSTQNLPPPPPPPITESIQKGLTASSSWVSPVCSGTVKSHTLDSQ